MAAMFAVLTRLRRPSSEQYAEAVQGLVAELTAVEKMDLYTDGQPPSRLGDDAGQALRGVIPAHYDETQA
jgi:hypothetical protein